MFDSVKDSGSRETFSTGAVRDTGEGKGRYDLLPAYAIQRLAVHFENGAKKYADENWRRGMPLRRYIDSALRHLFKYLEGQRDEDHAAAAAWNVMALIETEEMIRRGVLPVELRNLPDWTGTNVQVTVNGEPSDAAASNATVGDTVEYHHRMPEPVLEPIGLMDDDLPFVHYKSTKNNEPRIYRLNGDSVQISFHDEPGKWQNTIFTAKDFGKWVQEGTLVPVPADLDACGTTDGTTPIGHAAETAQRFTEGQPYRRESYDGQWVYHMPGGFASDILYKDIVGNVAFDVMRNGERRGPHPLTEDVQRYIDDGSWVPYVARPSSRIASIVQDSITWLREH